MSKVIEVDFLPKETDVAFSWLDSIGDSTRRILIVDNDKNTTHLVKVLLEKTGRYLVCEENDGDRAHQTAHNFRPDLIFLDVVMPGRDGGDIAAQIRADPELQYTSIISHSARHEGRSEH
jgi:CheY-like chemotaxis protein